jgi:hypothetical protein
MKGLIQGQTQLPSHTIMVLLSFYELSVHMLCLVWIGGSYL